jgi:hypothetical protein
MSNENTNQTDTQTTAAEKETYPCACSHCGCTSDGFSEDKHVGKCILVLRRSLSR